MHGFHNKLLRINVNQRLFKEEAEEVCRKFLGGKGLGTYLLLDNTKPGAAPLSRDDTMKFRL